MMLREIRPHMLHFPAVTKKRNEAGMFTGAMLGVERKTLVYNDIPNSVVLGSPSHCVYEGG